MSVLRMLHVALAVTDLRRSVAFYRDVLGFAVIADAMAAGEASARALGVASEGLEIALLERDGNRLELIRSVAPEPAPSGGYGTLSHLAFAVDDLEATVRTLPERGVEVVAETLTEPAYGVRSCLIRDPDGFPVLLHQAPSGVASPWAER